MHRWYVRERQLPKSVLMCSGHFQQRQPRLRTILGFRGSRNRRAETAGRWGQEDEPLDPTPNECKIVRRSWRLRRPVSWHGTDRITRSDDSAP